jgi:subtilase family serine protease
MKTMLLSSTPKLLMLRGWLAACALVATTLGAQTPAPRIQAEVSSSSVSTLPGSLHPLAQAQYDSGRVPADTRLSGVSIVFSRSAAQQADLEALIAAQQNPSSPLYHQWLNPDQFAVRFGMAQSDVNKVQAWLEQQGFSVDSVARSRNMIRFSGSAGQVEQAFQTQMHYYTSWRREAFRPFHRAVSPLSSNVRGIGGQKPRRFPAQAYDREKPDNPGQSRISPPASPAASSSPPATLKWPTGSMRSSAPAILELGSRLRWSGSRQSSSPTDIENFENAAGLTVKDPNQVLVPGTGTPQTFAGDEGESDLDVEWAGGIAPGAEIFFVYTGSSTNFGVFDSIQYAVDEKIGNIITASYGSCEAGLPAGSATALDAVLAQAATQGQTVLAASGDSGSSACYVSPTTTSPVLATQEELSVSYPASSQYVTGVGGTEITAADDVSTNSTYWEAKGTSSDEITSLLQYIPEVAWNDDAAAVAAGATSLSATGGGVSTLYTTSPSWQKGVPGIPTTPGRYVPDVAFYASPDLPGYLFCTSDTSDWNTSQQASCNSGFRDSATQDLTIAGGTSFATPVFAGMVAILNQAQGYASGQGLINPTLYTLASNATTYAAAFHDVPAGSNNECPSSLGANYCSTASEGSYATTTGYDPVTGLGSVNLGALVTAWPLSTATLIGTTTTVTAASATPAISTNDTITITVASDTGTTIPTGTVTLSIDGCGTSYGTTAVHRRL